MSALVNPFFWFALALGVWALWRLVRWMASGGQLPLRRRRGSASGFTAAGFSAQSFYQPSAEHLVEMTRQQETRREDEDEGDQPVSGLGPGAEERSRRAR